MGFGETVGRDLQGDGQPDGQGDRLRPRPPALLLVPAEELGREVAAWEEERNERRVGVNWRFTTADARIRLRRLYPSDTPLQRRCGT